MIGTILCVAAMTLGVDFGWEPNGDGGLEYIVQIDPESLETLGKGAPLRSDFPRDLRGLQTIRFQVGDKKPPRVALAPPLLPPDQLAQPENSRDKRLSAQPAVYVEPSGPDEPSKAEPGKENENTPIPDPQKPWPLLYVAVGTAIGLAAAFFYLLWIHIGIRSRYRVLLADHLASLPA
jgi:hypothetical protein